MKFSSADCPPSVTSGGYVYALAFSNGSVKVGKSTNPGGRITVHVYNASRFGINLTDWWVSPAHDAYPLTESALKGIALALSPDRRATERTHEYFHGVDFGALVELCHELDIDVQQKAAGTAVASAGSAGEPVAASPSNVVRLPDRRPLAPVTDFGSMVVTARIRLGLTQDAVVVLTGISRSTLTRWENNKAERPGAEQVRALCDVLGIPILEAVVALGFLTPDDLAGEAA